jgi:hypothetical protein
MVPADIDPVSFCRLVSDIKNQGNTIAMNAIWNYSGDN